MRGQMPPGGLRITLQRKNPWIQPLVFLETRPLLYWPHTAPPQLWPRRFSWYESAECSRVPEEFSASSLRNRRASGMEMPSTAKGAWLCRFQAWVLIPVRADLPRRQHLSLEVRRWWYQRRCHHHRHHRRQWWRRRYGKPHREFRPPLKAHRELPPPHALALVQDPAVLSDGRHSFLPQGQHAAALGDERVHPSRSFLPHDQQAALYIGDERAVRNPAALSDDRRSFLPRSGDERAHPGDDNGVRNLSVPSGDRHSFAPQNQRGVFGDERVRPSDERGPAVALPLVQDLAALSDDRNPSLPQDQHAAFGGDRAHPSDERG
mmetsp:Transcript_6059/g.14622  ORF Transcript_6059/g.14622 Transcript_6059/m.14622 type:complete len:320 (-) Transcript_6059:841-1800(-)